MRIYKNDIIKASTISTGADRGVLLCSITDSGFTSIAGVISAVKDKLPGKDHKKMIFEIRNDGRNEYGRWVIIHHFTSKMKNDIHLYETSYRVSPIPSTGCSKVRSPDSFTKNVFDFTHLTFSRWNLISKTS